MIVKRILNFMKGISKQDANIPKEKARARKERSQF
jgi:hypothetical protein